MSGRCCCDWVAVLLSGVSFVSGLGLAVAASRSVVWSGSLLSLVGDHPVLACVMEAEVEESSEVDRGGSDVKGLPVAFDTAVADSAVAVGDEPGDGSFDHGSVLPVVVQRCAIGLGGEPDPANRMSGYPISARRTPVWLVMGKLAVHANSPAQRK